MLWIDEIEKALASSSDESDVGKRVLGQFLFWLQESQAKVFMVATANDVSKLPPELFRKGRFSEVFFVDLPNRAERAEALRHYCQRALHAEYSGEDIDVLVTATKGFSYSDIEQSIMDYAELVAFGHAPVPDVVQLAAHFDKVVSISEANEGIAQIRAWGREHAVSAS